MKISFDLDNTLFDMEEVYKMACREYNVKYTRPKHWAVYDCYPKEVADRMLELFAEDVLYTMPIINKKYVNIINDLIKNKEHEIYFVTERRLKQPEKSYQQITNSGIKCDFKQVYDKEPPKYKVLQEIGVDLHFDDSHNIVQDCLNNNIPIIMISNHKTLYNHFLRSEVEHYKNIKEGLKAKGIIR